MKKSGILADALRSSGATVAAAQAIPPASDAPAPSPAAPTPRLAVVKAAPRPKTAVAPSRENKKSFTVHLPEVVRRQVKLMAVEQGRNMDDLMAEGLNLLFAKYRKPELAPMKSRPNA